jgi:hypothetical protein
VLEDPGVILGGEVERDACGRRDDLLG